MASLCSCATILGKSRTNVKENYSSLYHVMARLAKQEQLDRYAWNIKFVFFMNNGCISAKYVLRFVFSVTMLAPAFFSLSLENPGDIKVLNILRPFHKSV